MTLQQLRYALAICSTGSFSRASEQLYVSQPSLSAAIHDLEDEFGITIFHRTSRGVSLTNEGSDFITRARMLYAHYEDLLEHYGRHSQRKTKFGVSTQHYSFAVKAFVEMVKNFNTSEYDFALRETITNDVIDDVAKLKSEIGILFLSTFNRASITRLLRQNGLVFTTLCRCQVFAYLWKKHPLAGMPEVTLDMLRDYPNLSFEQGSNSSFYFAEEIYCTNDYQRSVRVNDRATMLNLMVGLLGYTLCSGVICEDLNGSDFIAVPYCASAQEGQDEMEIGYISRAAQQPTSMARLYVEELRRALLAATADRVKTP